jgi:hypothetical protein
MTICPNPRRWFHRCNFEPRYSTGPAQGLTPEQIASIDKLTMYMEDVPGVIGTLTRPATTYVGDVCIKCGTFIHGEQEDRK